MQGASGKPPASGITRQLCREQFSVKRPDAPTTAREWNLSSQGAFTLFFRWRKKSVQKKASGTALREKGSYCPFGGGARNVVRNGVGQLIHKGGAHSCSPFSAAKMGGPFSLRCLTPLCSLAVDTGRTQIAVLGSYSAAWRLRSAEKQTLFFSFTVGARHA